jgi:hypothetical protein
LGLATVLLLVVGFALRSSFGNGYTEKFFAVLHERMRDLAVGRRSDIVLNLISDGILHSRVFGF